MEKRIAGSRVHEKPVNESHSGLVKRLYFIRSLLKNGVGGQKTEDAGIKFSYSDKSWKKYSDEAAARR